MPTFAYSGRTRGGQTVTGERIAETADAAVAGVAPRSNPGDAHRSGQGQGRAPGRQGGQDQDVPAKNLAIFTRQFSVMIDAGLPLVQCLDILGKQEPNKHFSAAILRCAKTSRRARRSPRR